ncbi:MAG: hypothetical protein J5616_08935 [Bacteroidaceae bacterium]|nr:hypothetical protein [Bacteroidaceae bacterium]
MTHLLDVVLCHLHFTLIFPSIRFQAFVHRHCAKISSKSGRFRLDFCYVFDYHAESHPKMEPAWEKTCGLKFQLTSRTIVQPNGGTREVPCYILTKTECVNKKKTKSEKL